MCGIAGCVASPGEAPDRAALEAMAAALAHRGPDDVGIEIAGNVGLVHRRLSIVDPSPAGHEPMRHPERGWWLTYNGEIFNHLELRARLPPLDYRGSSDAESLLHALACEGTDALPGLNGFFAFAALDPRGELLLVRDRFGVKPLYLAEHAGGLWFASEIGALLAAGVPRQARPDVLLHATRHGWANGPLTPAAGVERVLPGTLLRIDTETLARTEERWYEPAAVVDAERMDELAALSPKAVDARVEEALRESVHARLMADVPVGTMCSGGLDSSLITALAAEKQRGLLAFNATVPGQPEADEGPWAEQVAGHLGVELCSV
jgi:asparagine synthase (glutamine-hydrolysing)